MSGADAAGVPWRPECLCWCQVRPVVCTLSCCGCIAHDHGGKPPLTGKAPK